MGLRHAVITSVDRDDLPDLGSAAFVAVIREIRRQAPGCQIEVLTPDFQGQEMPLARVIAARPDVFNHNVEVVPRLYPLARRGSVFARSARVLRNAKELGGDEVTTKSGLMVGLGETHEEMVETFGLLREHDVQVLTIGQYLRPSRAAPADRPLLAPRRVRGARARGLRARLRARRGRPARALLLPRRPARGAGAAGGRPAGDSRLRPGGPGPRHLIPLRDSIRLERLPLVTIALIAANVVAYLIVDPAGGSIIDGPTAATIVDYGAIPYEFTHLSSHCDARRSRLQPGRAVQRAAARGRLAAGAAGDLGDRVHGDVPARQPAPHRRQHDLPRRSSAARSRTRIGRLRFLAFYLLGGLAALALHDRREPGLRRRRRSAPRARSRPCSAATSCSTRGRGS